MNGCKKTIYDWSWYKSIYQNKMRYFKTSEKSTFIYMCIIFFSHSYYKDIVFLSFFFFFSCLCRVDEFFPLFSPHSIVHKYYTIPLFFFIYKPYIHILYCIAVAGSECDLYLFIMSLKNFNWYLKALK